MTGIAHILGRRSIRKFLDRAVDRGSIELLLQAAMAAPSARTCDPWRFIVVDDRSVIEQISSVSPNANLLAAAPLAVVACGEQMAAHSAEAGYLLQDCSASIENILLAAHALGLGACWLGIYPREDRVTALRDLLGIPSGVLPVAVVALGYPGEKKEARTRYNVALVHHNTWTGSW